MIRLPKALFLAATALAASAGVAAAQDPPPDGDPAAPAPTGDPATTPAADEAGAPSLTLGKGKILIAGSTVNINLSSDFVGKPISLAPSVWYGVNEKLTIGLTHDNGTTPWSPRASFRTFTTELLGQPVTLAAGSGICLASEENGCPEVYDNVGVDALYALKAGKFSVAAHPALDINGFDPFLLALRVGVLGRYEASSKLSIVFDPRVRIGITERDFNKEEIDIPVWVWFAANPKAGVYAHTGIAGALDGFGDTYRIPLGVGASYSVNAKFTAGLDFMFTNLIGNNGDADGRALAIRAAYAL